MFEKKSPYNFCDRWCERCPSEKQRQCRLYLDEFEQKIACIAYGRKPGDEEVTAEIMRQQFEATEKIIERYLEENEIDLESADAEELELVKRQEESVQNNSLHRTAQAYFKKAGAFLEEVFFKKRLNKPELRDDFEILAWYYTLLPVKLYRALCGFHEAVSESSPCAQELSEEEFELCDAVAQFEICKKAILESIKAWRKIMGGYPDFQAQIKELLALLDNIYSRIEMFEETI